jgi:hypothetical protein
MSSVRGLLMLRLLDYVTALMASLMKDAEAQLEKLLTEASECALIASLATDKKKRDLFARLAGTIASWPRGQKGNRASDAPLNLKAASVVLLPRTKPR